MCRRKKNSNDVYVVHDRGGCVRSRTLREIVVFRGSLHCFPLWPSWPQHPHLFALCCSSQMISNLPFIYELGQPFLVEVFSLEYNQLALFIQKHDQLGLLIFHTKWLIIQNYTVY